MYSSQDVILRIIPEQVLAELSVDLPPYDLSDPDSSDKINRAIEQADREIDSYLAVRHPVPLQSPFPGLIVFMSARMAIHAMHVRKHIYSEVWEREYERCLRILEKIASGEMGIGAPDGTGDPASEVSLPVTKTRQKKFTAEMWSSF